MANDTAESAEHENAVSILQWINSKINTKLSDSKTLLLNITSGYLRRFCTFRLRRVVNSLLNCIGYKHPYSLTLTHHVSDNMCWCIDKTDSQKRTYNWKLSLNTGDQ